MTSRGEKDRENGYIRIANWIRSLPLRLYRQQQQIVRSGFFEICKTLEAARIKTNDANRKTY